ncbi:MAG: sigma-70 family RNA polymerase sigma factor [Acidobacteriota bacterium]|nr:sigma-70 family RNA polymerase sigma factor [Acidobacteriota bacterium]MDH3529064.1 sigma-70 family RNA polymerase sigma factor [Acidobacteriota bacterium]
MPDTERKLGPFSAAPLGKDDAVLVGLCRKGDESAWSDLVDRYQRLVFAIPRRAGLSEAQAADVLQEVFLTLFEKLDEIERPEKIRSWLVTTAKFKTWGTVRRDKGLYSPETEEEMEFEMANLKDDSPLAEDALVLLEEQHMIRTALKKLSEKCQKILRMIYLTEPAASYAEVADAIGVGATSISPLRSRCLKKLERVLVAV